MEIFTLRRKRIHREENVSTTEKNVSTAVETCYENLENRENLHIPYGPLYVYSLEALPPHVMRVKRA